MRVGSHPMTGVPVEEGSLAAGTQGEGSVKLEAEPGVTCA